MAERAYDASRGITALETFEGRLDLSRIAVTGNSGGGKTAYYSACYDGRITAVVPSCSVCSLARSGVSRELCDCAYPHGMLRWFDMADLAVLIAPRPLIIVSGEKDHLFPSELVRRDFEVISEIYRRVGAEDGCRHLIGDAGHQYYPELAWPALARVHG